jgi:hypothetical protein
MVVVVVELEAKGRTCHVMFNIGGTVGSRTFIRIYSPDELSQKIIGSNELSLPAIKVTRFRKNKGSNEVTKKATTPQRHRVRFRKSRRLRSGWTLQWIFVYVWIQISNSESTES